MPRGSVNENFSFSSHRRTSITTHNRAREDESPRCSHGVGFDSSNHTQIELCVFCFNCIGLHIRSSCLFIGIVDVLEVDIVRFSLHVGTQALGIGRAAHIA